MIHQGTCITVHCRSVCKKHQLSNYKQMYNKYKVGQCVFTLLFVNINDDILHLKSTNLKIDVTYNIIYNQHGA